MSAIASFFLLNTANLKDLQAAKDNYWTALNAFGRELKSFDGSGFIYGLLPAFFEMKDAGNLFKNEYKTVADELDETGGVHFIFTNSQRISFSEILQPGHFSEEELQTFHQEFFGDDEVEDTSASIADAIEVLYSNLNEVRSDNDVLLLIVS